MTIKRYSSYPQFETSATGENVSNVFDRLLRITTKITERYASDILYVIDAFHDTRAKNQQFYRILAFREEGVNAYKSVNDIHDVSEFIQVWELVYMPDTKETMLRRARLSGY